jgi:hypothetical protein
MRLKSGQITLLKMCAFSAAMVPASAWICTGELRCDAHRINHQGQRRHMVQVRMGQQHMVDAAHFFQRQIAHAGAGIDKDVIVNQERRGSAVLGDRAGTAQHPDLHPGTSLGLKVGRAVPLGIEGQQPH